MSGIVAGAGVEIYDSRGHVVQDWSSFDTVKVTRQSGGNMTYWKPSTTVHALRALDAVIALHQPMTVYHLGDDDEMDLEKPQGVLCVECTDPEVVDDFGDLNGCFDSYTPFPCKTFLAATVGNQ